ncbi:MAG: AMIN domain-containing protein [Chromatiaceae bacterium]|nr:MAG: AMIN domain-containing protein [Chromatiaceae bacterium]
MNRRVAVRLMLLSAAAVTTRVVAATSVRVEEARLWSAPHQTRLVVDIDSPVEHRIFPLADPNRLVIDLARADLLGGLPLAAADDPLVAGLRSGVRDGTDLRIVLDLKQPVRARSFLLPPNETYGHRLVVELAPRQAAAAGPVRRSASGADGQQVREVVVAVDAGHGGEDPGAIGPGGTHEKAITLSVARRLAVRIDAHPGMRAVLIRDGDYFVGLRQRIELARAARADLFVSVHADAFKDPRVRGSSVFTLAHGEATSEAARWLAERENRADMIGGLDLRERQDSLASVLLDMTQNATIEHSGLAAERVLGRLRIAGEVHNPRVQQAGFVVLKSPDVPSLLVETAFISNPEEERRLRNPRHQERLAEAILAGIVEYFSAYPPPETRFARAGGGGGERRHRISHGETLSGIAQSYRVPVQSLRSANQLHGDRIDVGQELVIPGS